MRNINYNSLASFGDFLHRKHQLISTITTEVAELLTAFTAGINPQEDFVGIPELRGEIGREFAAHNNRVLLPTVIDEEIELPEQTIRSVQATDALTNNRVLPFRSILLHGELFVKRPHAFSDVGDYPLYIIKADPVAECDLLQINFRNFHLESPFCLVLTKPAMCRHFSV